MHSQRGLAHLLAYGSYLAALRLVCRGWRAAVKGAAWEDGRLRIALQEGLPIEPLVALLGRCRERVRAVSIGYPRGKEEQWRDLEDMGTAWIRYTSRPCCPRCGPCRTWWWVEHGGMDSAAAQLLGTHAQHGENGA